MPSLSDDDIRTFETRAQGGASLGDDDQDDQDVDTDDSDSDTSDSDADDTDV